MNHDAKQLYTANAGLHKMMEDYKNEAGDNFDENNLPTNIKSQQKKVEDARTKFGGWWNKSFFGDTKGEGQ